MKKNKNNTKQESFIDIDELSDYGLLHAGELGDGWNHMYSLYLDLCYPEGCFEGRHEKLRKALRKSITKELKYIKNNFEIKKISQTVKILV